ncbi:hypothetical protein [Streptococcus equi]|nr:hypothetical protein [Streptococcus equi]MCD3367458.1 hypothetical protein [Streptococcus equi subsp. zooepidemicus]MCD3367459.1 hypothetical protein [Streptococcus equi subsp. zooepidemicus]
MVRQRQHAKNKLNSDSKRRAGADSLDLIEAFMVSADKRGYCSQHD